MSKKSMSVTLIVVGIFIVLIGCTIFFMPTNSSEDELAKVTDPVAPSDTVQFSKDAAPQKDVKEIGNDFEDVVVNLLADYRFKLLDRTQDAVSSEGVYAESCKNPDLHISQKRGESDVDYYLECKYRSHWEDNKVTFYDWQIDRYRKFQGDSRRKVLIALGVGGTPSAPATFMILPIDSINGYSIKKTQSQFKLSPSSDNLFNYMTEYFTEVFNTAKTRKYSKAK
ncbi:MAG: hypothetical protein NC221_08655 [Duncaniella sp.]|nr:hypothetical protein [Duncaniella sp.]